MWSHHSQGFVFISNYLEYKSTNDEKAHNLAWENKTLVLIVLFETITLQNLSQYNAKSLDNLVLSDSA